MLPFIKQIIKKLLKYLRVSGEQKKVYILTVAKVGSSDFLYSLKNDDRFEIFHNHSLLSLKTVLTSQKKTLIIVGVRNPIDRNLSYLFQTYSDNFYNTVKIEKNNYKGEYCYIGTTEELIKMDNNSLIKAFFEKNYHYTFNDWFNEFFEITGINNLSFNKEKGLEYYTLPNNNVLMIYTLEKLNENKQEICSYLKINDLLHSNNSSDRIYSNKYKEIKEHIKYPRSHLDSLLNSDIMNFFYSKEDIDSFYAKYKISP